MKTKEQRELQLKVMVTPLHWHQWDEGASLPIIIIFGHHCACHQKELLYQRVGGGSVTTCGNVNGTTTRSGDASPSTSKWDPMPTFNAIVEFF
jgi:hypothetical protein